MKPLNWARLTVCAILITPVVADAQSVEVVASGLNNPRGLAFAPTGDLYVAEAGSGGNEHCHVGPTGPRCFGPTGAIVRIDVRSGETEVVVDGLPSLAPASGASATGPHDLGFQGLGNLYFTIGFGGNPALRASALGAVGATMARVGRVTADGALSLTADIGTFEGPIIPTKTSRTRILTASWCWPAAASSPMRAATRYSRSTPAVPSGRWPCSPNLPARRNATPCQRGSQSARTAPTTSACSRVPRLPSGSPISTVCLPRVGHQNSTPAGSPTSSTWHSDTTGVSTCCSSRVRSELRRWRADPRRTRRDADDHQRVPVRARRDRYREGRCDLRDEQQHFAWGRGSAADRGIDSRAARGPGCRLSHLEPSRSLRLVVGQRSARASPQPSRGRVSTPISAGGAAFAVSATLPVVVNDCRPRRGPLEPLAVAHAGTVVCRALWLAASPARGATRSATSARIA